VRRFSALDPRATAVRGSSAVDQARSDRTDAAAGIAFVVLILISAFVAGTPPKVTDPTPDIRRFLVDERDSLQAAAFFTGLAMIALLWFLGTLRAELRALEGGEGRLAEIAFGSGIALIALTLAGTALAVAPTLHAQQLNPSTLRALFDTQGYVYTLIAFPVAGLAASSSAVLLRTGGLARAAGMLGVVTAAVSVISGLALYGESDSFFSIGGGIGFVSFLLSILWVLVTSVALLLGVRAPGVAPGPVREAPVAREP
jgi:hypothetical protein